MNHIPDYVRPGGKSYVSPEGLIYCTDGKVRWVHEIDQRKTPTVLFGLLGKYVGLCAALSVLILLVQAGNGGVEALRSAVPVTLILMAAGAVFAAILYGVHLLRSGPFVCRVYTLDEQRITCQQVRGKTDREKVTHAFAVWVGGQSQPAVRVCALREADLAHVRAITANPAKNRIRLRGKNTAVVYTQSGQFQVVLDCLKERCSAGKRG